MRPQPKPVIAYPRRPIEVVSASTQSAVKAYLTTLIGAVIAVGLVVWDYRARSVASLDDTLRAGTDPGVPLVLAVTVALATVGLALHHYRRFRILARDEVIELTQLDAAAETLRALLGTVSHGVILTNLHGRIRLFNPAAEILFGRLGEETLALPIQTLIPELHLADESAISLLDPAHGPRVRNLVGVRANGVQVPLRLLIRTLTLEGEIFWLLLAEDMTDHDRHVQRLEFLETRDPLTGLQNRATFERMLAAVPPMPLDTQRTHAVCLIDIDRFKSINDTLGHAAGNYLLEQLGRIFTTRLPCAAVARLSGDEFAALFVASGAPDAQTPDVQAVCENLVASMRHQMFAWQEHSFDIRLSAGLAFFDPAETTAYEALSQADIACRVAKEKGRDRLHVYGHGDAESIRHRHEIAIVPAIGSALNDGRFQIMAQPIRPLQDSTGPTHYEILVRMINERGDAVVPDAFIAAAERHVLMPAIDRWIINHVFTHQAGRLRAWHADHPDRYMLAINLSGTTLMDDSFAAYLKRQFAEHAIPYPSICFEVTETAAVVDLRRARLFMQEIRALGAAFAVDDFGTGFASYAYLKHLPVDYLKIDGSFVRNLAADPVDHALVSSINHLGHVLGLKTIAEWAEDEQLIEILTAIGVDYAQGFGVGKPIRLEDLPTYTALRTGGAAARRSDPTLQRVGTGAGPEPESGRIAFRSNSRR